MKSFKILAINPGSTSTKVTLFENDKVIIETNISHSWEETKDFKHIIDQLPMREKAISEFLDKNSINVKDLDATVGRGGYMKRLYSGTYEVCDNMISDIRNAVREHASNLGVLLADYFAKKAGVKSYTVNPIVVNETLPIARISGLKEVERDTLCHCLSQKEIARRMAESLGKTVEECNFVVAHMGGGISVGSHQKGIIIDATASDRGEGPFTPTRAGGLHPGQLVDLCFKSGLNYEQINDKLMKTGGLVSYLGTDDGRKVEERISKGDEYAELIYQAMAYQVSREIGANIAVLKGKVDAIGLTGGLAHSKVLTDWIRERVEFAAPVYVFPGELEMSAMDMGVLGVLRGDTICRSYDDVHLEEYAGSSGNAFGKVKN